MRKPLGKRHLLVKTVFGKYIAKLYIGVAIGRRYLNRKISDNFVCAELISAADNSDYAVLHEINAYRNIFQIAIGIMYELRLLGKSIFYEAEFLFWNAYFRLKRKFAETNAMRKKICVRQIAVPEL